MTDLWSDLAELMKWRDELSPAEIRKLMHCEFPPPEVVQIPRREFEEVRKAPWKYGIKKLRRDPHHSHWLLDDKIVEIIEEGEDPHELQRHRSASRRAQRLREVREAGGLV